MDGTCLHLDLKNLVGTMHHKHKCGQKHRYQLLCAKRTDMLKMVRSHIADKEEQTPIHCFQKVNTRKRG